MLLLSVALAVAAPAAAAPVADTAITVTGETLTDAQISQQANNYVRSILPPNPGFDQYARWNVPVCIKVSGIADVYAEMVTARIRNAAKAAAVTLAGPGCQPNLLVVFSPDAGSTAATIVRKRPRYFEAMNGTDLDRLRKASLPVRWWHAYALAGNSGVPAGQGSAALALPMFEGGGSVGGMTGGIPTTSSYNSSLIDTGISVGATSAVAIVDIPLATGKSLDAVADYVAMVTLAPSRLPPATPDANSILALFTDGAAPQSLSNWDNAFLVALYDMPMNRTALRQRGQLASRIGAEIKATDTPP
jgi:hypothetical protein